MSLTEDQLRRIEANKNRAKQILHGKKVPESVSKDEVKWIYWIVIHSSLKSPSKTSPYFNKNVNGSPLKAMLNKQSQSIVSPVKEQVSKYCIIL